MEELPPDLMIDILSRLPVKTIVHCKCVCKKWRNLVSDSNFVKLHLSRSPTGLIIHYHDHDPRIYTDPGILKWVELEDKVDHHHLHRDALMILDLKLAPILQNSLTGIAGSVNGLICLWQYYPKLDKIYICNPIAREYMILPSRPSYRKGYGFGVSSLTGDYKVVRIFRRSMPSNVLEAEVYTLGTGQWRSLGRVPYRLYRLNRFHEPFAAFMNGYCHWIVYDEEDAADDEKLCRFDLDKETFELFSSPPIEGIENNNPRLGVLKGCLCEIDTNVDQLTIWVMKEYGIKESWYKELVITEEISRDLKWPMWVVSMIEGLKDGSILTICDDKLWTFYPRSQTIEVTEMVELLACGLAYRPTFLKLQNFELERVHIF